MNARLRFVSLLGGMVLLGCLTASPSLAQNGTWNTTTNGTWTTAGNWVSNTIADGADNNANFTFNITNALGVTLGANRTIGNITFNDSSHDMTILGSDILTLDRTSGLPVIDVTQSGRTLTISSQLAGNDGLQKNGAGTLVLSNASNNSTFSGNITINAGTLNYTTAGSLPASQNFTFSGNSTLSLANAATPYTGGALTVDAGVVASLFPSTGNSQTFASAASGSNTSVLQWTNGVGSSTLTVNDASAFTGILRVGPGSSSNPTLTLGNLADGVGYGNLQFAGSTSNAATFQIFNNSGPLTFDNRQIQILSTSTVATATLSNIQGNASNTWAINTDLINSRAGTTTLTLSGNNTGDNTFGGVIGNGSGTINLSKTGTGRWAVSGANTYNGTTSITGGTLQLGNGTGSGSLATNSAISMSAGATFAINQSDTVTQGTDFSSAVLTGAGNFTQAGSGTTVLNLANTFNGTTTVSAGTLRLDINNALQNSILSTSGAGAVNLNTGVTAPVFGGLSGANALASVITSGYTGNVTSLTLNTLSGTTATYSGVIADGATGMSLTKNGTGTQTLSGNNSFTGGIVLNAGTLRLSGTQSFTGGVTLNGGNFGDTTTALTAAALNGNNITVNATAAMAVSGGGNNITGNVLINSAGTFRLGEDAGTADVSGVLSGTGVLDVFSPGGSGSSINLNSLANTFTGGVLWSAPNNGGFNLSVNSFADSASPGAGNLVMGNGGATSTQTFTLNTGAVAPLTFTNRQFSLTGNASAQTHRIANNSAQAFIINSNLSTSNATGTKTLTLGGTGAGIGTFGGTIANGGLTTLNLTKADTGIWRLSGNNSYSGITTVSGGTLEVNSLADGSNNSSIGASGSGAANLLLANGARFRYVGSGHSSNRSFTINGTAAGQGATLDASGSGAVIFTSTSTPAYGTANQTRTLTLTGTNTGNNTLAANLADNGTGAVSLTKTGIGTWVLRGNNSATGATTISGGGDLVLDYGTEDNSKLSSSSALTLSNGAGDITLRGGSHVEAVGSLTVGAGGGHTSITRDGGSSTIAFGAITRTQSGYVTMSLAEDNLATTSSAVVNGILTGGISVGSNWAKVSSGNIVALTAGDYTAMSANATTSTVNYQLTGSLTRNSTASVNSLRIVSDGNDQVLDMGVGNLTPSPLTGTLGNGAGGGILYAGGGNGNYTITGTGNLQAQNGNQELIINTFQGTLNVAMRMTTGTQGLSKAGVGTLVLSGNSTYTGPTHVNQGGLQLRHNFAAGTSGAITVHNGGALELANSVSIAGNKSLTITGYGMSDGGALRNIASNTSSYAGAITIGTGGARVNSDTNGSLTLSGLLTTSLLNDVTFGGAGNTTVSGNITGAGSLIKDGDGTINVTFANTYTGGTSVIDGLLQVNNTTGSGTGTGAVTIGALGSIGGNGTIGGALTVNGSIAPGNSIGVLTVANDVTWNGAASSPWVFELGGNSTADLLAITGSTSDFLKGTGTGGSDFVFDFASSTDQGTFTLVSWNGTTNFVASDFSYQSLGGGNTGSFQVSGSTLQFIVVPEPATMALLGAGVTLLALRIGRRRKA